jgi:tetratricopeptide (TPR) repeat protein
MLDPAASKVPSMSVRLTFALLLGLCAGTFCRAAEVRQPNDGEALDRRIAELIAQLGDEEYAARQRAQEALIKIGFDAFDALTAAEQSDDPEIALQASYLVRLIRVDWTSEDDPSAIQAILKDYETQSEERRLLRIKQLAELPDELGLEWLCRIVRFEESPVLSKQAALAIIEQKPPRDPAAAAKRSALLRAHMERSRRPAAAWLLADLRADEDPQGALAVWSELTATERRTLDAHPQETSSRVVMALLLRQVALLERLGRSDQVGDVMHQMVLCERGDPASLGELVGWLAGRKAWNVIDELATRFAATFDLDAMLLYKLAEARRAQGNQTLADETAGKALKLGGDNPLEHLDVAGQLLEQGLTEWSDRELRHVIALGPIASPAGIRARLILSDSLHDRLRDAEAGELLRGLMEAIDSDANVMQQVKLLLQQSDKSVDFLRARMYFYAACAAEHENNPDEQRKLLDKAIDQEPADLDVLIALYRSGDDDPARRERVSKLIKNVADDCRTAIDESPDDPVNYNELAWLVANTEGDVDEAVRLSHKSVELVRAEATSEADFRRLGQYLDTLGHCYFAKKDYASAVKYQSEAAKLDPHTRAIARQLAVFREALEKASATEAPAADK